PNGNGAGARWDRDGLDAAGFVFCAIGEYIDSEQFEEDYPLLPIYRSRFWKDGHGFGKHRGGRSMHVAWRVHNVPQTIALSLSGFSYRPITGGLYGGYANRPNGIVFIQGNNWDEVAEDGRAPSNFQELMETVEGDTTVEHVYGWPHVMNEGDIVAAFTPSAPGYGDVLERDPEDVMRDLKEESITHFTAREVYKVIYDPESFFVDFDATVAARAAERSDRLARSKPTPEFLEEWSKLRPADEALGYFGTWPDALPVAPG
ncbi:MAG: hydantoinase B/oxoprolinase family protein, partial [Acidimicrobiia bacterium]